MPDEGRDAVHDLSARRAAEERELELLAERLVPLASPVRLRLLRFLTRPHYLEEIASYLGLTRQAARKHVDQLVEIGVLDRQSGTRETGPVTEYLVNPSALYLLYDEFEKLASLRRAEEPDVLSRTVAQPGARPLSAPAGGPCLTVVRGLNLGQRHRLPPAAKEWTIGRDTTCAIAVPYDAYASNRHAEVRYEGGRYLLTDLRSTNGTLHNFVLLARGGEVELAHGDVVGVGKTVLLFWGP